MGHGEGGNEEGERDRAKQIPDQKEEGKTASKIIKMKLALVNARMEKANHISGHVDLQNAGTKVL